MTIMTKPILAFLILAVSVSHLRAEDGDEEPTSSPASTPAASAAARNKGYHAEQAQSVTPPDNDEESPIERHPSSNSLVTAPPQRPLGAAERRSATAAEREARRVLESLALIATRP